MDNNLIDLKNTESKFFDIKFDLVSELSEDVYIYTSDDNI